MQKRLRDLLRAVVTDLRHTLTGGPNGQRGDLDRELERLGIAPDGTVTPFDALPNPTAADRKARRAAEAQLSAAQAANKTTARGEIVERAAYTWINRLLALRAMEARGLINPVLRADSAYDGLSEALFVLRQTHPQAAAGPDAGWWTVIEDACRAQAASLPGLFDLADPSASLRPSTRALLRCVALLGNPPAGYTADEADAAFADPDAIGWAYQFYQEEAKARTYAKLNAGGKAATRAEIASVTQLFTEPYMVKWLLQNSLGRTYHELYPDSRLPETWEYYIKDLPQDDAEDRRPPIDDLDGLTFMDPCMGSGHFEREAFDMLAAMYREQRPGLSAAEIADRVLSRHLHGIDLDPRAAQLAALTLYLRAWELVAEERRSRRLPGPGTYRPPALNLATTPTGLTPGSLERHLQRHPEDRVYRPLLEGIFAALEQADVLGSLLRPGEQLDAAIRSFRARADGQMQLVSEDADLNRLLAELAQHDPAELKRVLLARVARSFRAEVDGVDDVAAALFGREAGEGIRLVELLERRYAIVATNPPYMGSGNNSTAANRYAERNFVEGKRDLYAVFILRCAQLTIQDGRFAMIVLQSWLSKDSFYDLRSKILTEISPQQVVVLGRYAFSEVDPPGLPAMFVLKKSAPSKQASIWSAELGRTLESGLQAAWLRIQVNEANRGRGKFVLQSQIIGLPQRPFVLGFTARLLAVMTDATPLGDDLLLCEPLTTGDNPRFVRFSWETSSDERWRLMSKGGGYLRWHGLAYYTLDWRYSGAVVKAARGSYIRNQEMMFEPGITLSAMSRYGISFRKMAEGMTFGKAGPGIFPKTALADVALILLNAKAYQFWLRKLNPGASITLGNIGRLPSPPVSLIRSLTGWMMPRVRIAALLSAADPRESSFSGTRSFVDCVDLSVVGDGRTSATILETMLLGLCLDGYFDDLVEEAFDLDDASRAVVSETAGGDTGTLPMVEGYDAVPNLVCDPSWVADPDALESYLLQRKRIALGQEQLRDVKASLYALLTPNQDTQQDEEDETEIMDGAEGVAGGRTTFPTDNLLESMSRRLGVHPISVYWLLQELRAEGVRCKPEELRMLEDRLSVLVLRLLGHRWPRQIEAGEPVPPWADADGIIPLTPIAGETALAERLRDRLRDEDGDRGSQQVEALLLELAGLTPEEWLRRTFFSRHVRQFKHRPIAWHLASTPSKDGPRRGKVKREPAFQCLLYYHACRGDVLARLRAHYVEPLIRLETAAAADARRRGDETAAAIAVSRVHELEEFAGRLRAVAEEGFACAELDKLLADEPLDRWSGDGIVAPANAEELTAQERAWQVDINDGVRVNSAPLQLAGLLASEVLRPDDARKAIADRARWRSDERRWVRAGVLPRCGWLDEDVPESPQWTTRAPEREAEARKLEEKRRAVMEKLSPSDDLTPGKTHG